MNVNTRKLLTHVEFEPNTYGTAFAVELEAASSPLWSFVNACISLVGFFNSVIEVYIDVSLTKSNVTLQDVLSAWEFCQICGYYCEFF